VRDYLAGTDKENNACSIIVGGTIQRKMAFGPLGDD